MKVRLQTHFSLSSDQEGKLHRLSAANHTLRLEVARAEADLEETEARLEDENLR